MKLTKLILLNEKGNQDNKMEEKMSKPLHFINILDDKRDARILKSM